MFKLLGKLVKGVLIFLGGLVVLVCCTVGIMSDDVEEQKVDKPKTEQVVEVEDKDQVVVEDKEEKPTVKEQKEVEKQPELTLAQRNAVKSAESYLSFTAFSRKGLIQQLEFEGYSTEDATYAVDHVTVNWNEQCARTARSYLEFTSFSRQGLHDQLEYEGFTEEQIEYGLQAVGY